MEQAEETVETEFEWTTAEKELETLLDQGAFQAVDELLHDLEHSNRLILLSRLSYETGKQLIQNLAAERAAVYLSDLPESQQLDWLQSLSHEDAAEILQALPRDIQADLVGALSEKTQASILSEMEAESAQDVRDLIEYDDNVAGGIMILDFVSVPSNWSVRDVTTRLQESAEVYADYDVQYIYVVEPEGTSQAGKLVGVLRLRDLVMSPANTRIHSLMIPEPLAVNDHTGLRELYQFFDDHRFLGVPVTNEQGILLGILRRTDVEKAVTERYADAYLKSQGIVGEELRTMPLTLRSRRRLGWLSINIVLNLIAASVIAFYQDTLEQVIALAVFLPIISDMSGCSGNQAVAVSMRELGLGLIRPAEVGRVWLKEIGVGLINGLSLGLLVGLLALVWKGNPFLGVVVGAAMMINTIIAVSLGGTLPMVMRLLKIDPALASGPILTTVTDMCGFFLILGLASSMLDRLV